MKQRLESLPLTKEDMGIWVMIGHLMPPSRKHFGDVLDKISAASDRSDANLMFSFKVAYGDIMGPGYLYYRVWHAACAFQGIPIPLGYQV